MTDPELHRDEALDLLGGASVGRVTVTLAGVPHVVPVNYRVHHGAVVFRSGSGTKLAAALAEHPVSFEVDRIDENTQTGWSVLVSGRAWVVTEPAALATIAALDLVTWARAPTTRSYRSRPTSYQGVRSSADSGGRPPDDRAGLRRRGRGCWAVGAGGELG